jgi:hypothetical protein
MIAWRLAVLGKGAYPARSALRVDLSGELQESHRGSPPAQISFFQPAMSTEQTWGSRIILAERD